VTVAADGSERLGSSLPPLPSVVAKKPGSFFRPPVSSAALVVTAELRLTADTADEVVIVLFLLKPPLLLLFLNPLPFSLPLASTAARVRAMVTRVEVEKRILTNLVSLYREYSSAGLYSR
jgi:hypothetical protein